MERHDKQDPVVFDLVEGNRDAAPGSDDDASDGPPARRRLRLPRLSRRTWLVAASVVAAVVITMVAADLVRDHQRAELMRTSPAGVASLDGPPEEIWTLPFDFPAPGEGAFVDQQLVTMDGLLVLLPGRAQTYTVDASTGAAEPEPVGFEDVVAVDPGSGEIVWRVPVDERSQCGPSGYDGSASTDVLVCVHGPDDAREVLTIAPDGSTRSRAVDLADGEQIFPGPDGMVVRVTRTGDQTEHVECRPTGVCTPPVLTEGRDVLVIAEDAATGAERWVSIVEFTPVHVINCQEIAPGTGDAGPVVDADHVTVRSGAETVVVDGCGISATLSLPGVRLDLAVRTDPRSSPWVNELGPGRYTLQGDATNSVVVDEFGKIVRTLDGFVRIPATSPDAPDDLWFVFSGSHGFEAMRTDGTVAWTEPLSQSVLLAGRDVVVVNRGGRVAGLDRATGARLWTWGSEEVSGLSRYRTLTDGETVALEYRPRQGAGGGLLMALDLSTGEQLWDVPMTGMALAVDGYIVEMTTDGLTGLG
jgi:outer membrane protein assembly factor BamB